MTETASATHHKIKAEWTKTAENENFEEVSSGDDLEIAEVKAPKIQILDQVVICRSKSVKCHYCDKNFDRSVLLDHQKTHEKSFFDCSDCDKKFRRKSSLRKHCNFLHKGKFKYECKECKLTFIDLTKYELHVNGKHKPKENKKQFKCLDVDCNKTFTSADYLKRHQVTHSDDFKYECSACDQKFKWMTSLQVHQTIHTQNKTLVECKTCFKRFFNQRTLERHQKIHKNVKFKCTLCEKVVSNRKDNIRRHIRHIHNDVEKSKIATMIEAIEEPNKQFEDDNESDENESSVQPGKEEEPPVVDNRVRVIQSIGNPNKRQQIKNIEMVQMDSSQPPPEIVSVESSCQEDGSNVKPQPLLAAIEETAKIPQPAQEPHNSQERLPSQKPTENNRIKLPPKKKAIALSQPSNSVVSAPKPKYDPIEHYRKILLGFSKDDDNPTTIEDNTEEEEIDQEPQVFPIHWRKRTSQNFLFRR